NNIKGASTLPLFQVLKICYDLIPSISIKDLQEIINAGKNSNKNNDIIYSSDIGSSSIIGNDNNKELLSNEFIVKTLETLKKLQPYEKNLAIYKSFIMKCLEIVPSESKVSLYLYDRILSQPFPLMEPIPCKYDLISVLIFEKVLMITSVPSGLTFFVGSSTTP
ncbi:18267_t:CDS:2, partial [Entrophospora sp. SA101]